MASSSETSPATEFIWTHARVLEAEVAISASIASSLLPAALRLEDPPTATLFVADYPETRFGSVYREAAVLLHASDTKGPALHCPWMVVDDDTALILGRELLGFPKKLAEIRLDPVAGGLVASVSRKETEVMRLEAKLGELEERPAPLFGRRIVNVIGTPVTGMKLVDLPPAREVIHSSRSAQVKVALCSSERDPLGDLLPSPSGPARYLELDFASVGGPAPQLLGEVEADWATRRFFARAR